MNFSKEDTWPVFQEGIIDYFTKTIDSMLFDINGYVECTALQQYRILHYEDLSGKSQKTGVISYELVGHADYDSSQMPGDFLFTDRKYYINITLFPKSFQFQVTKLNDTECTRTFGNIQDAVLYILLLESLRAYGDTRPASKSEP
jgi:hypothetical protein